MKKISEQHSKLPRDTNRKRPCPVTPLSRVKRPSVWHLLKARTLAGTVLKLCFWIRNAAKKKEAERVEVLVFPKPPKQKLLQCCGLSRNIYITFICILLSRTLFLCFRYRYVFNIIMFFSTKMLNWIGDISSTSYVQRLPPVFTCK